MSSYATTPQAPFTYTRRPESVAGKIFGGVVVAATLIYVGYWVLVVGILALLSTSGW